MQRILIIIGIVGMLCLGLAGWAMAGDGLVKSEDLIQQLQQKPKTRGFVITNKQSVTTEAGQEAQPQVQAAQPSATIYVYFISGTVQFADEQSIAQLNELGMALTSKSLADARFEISGHTDSVGSDAYNMDLSNRRADAVSSYLVDNFGYLETVTKGYGESQPIASNDTAAGRAKNRRVVITRLD